MKIEVDSFSGSKIYPGRGLVYVRLDSKIFKFQCPKSTSFFLQKKNPRKVTWTVVYRKQNKKGVMEDVLKKKTRKVFKPQRSIVGASLEMIKSRRMQKPEERLAERKKKITMDKEALKIKKANRKAEKARASASGFKKSIKSSKPGHQKVHATSR